jgi:Ser/Thr protein kinase RdoA (MazF antagonist)
MTTFPTIYSSLDPKAILTDILSHYAIAPVRSCQFWHRGLSDIYMIETDDQSYVLRVSHHHWRKRTDIEFELQFLEFLHHHQIPIAYPLRTKRNQLLREINAPEGKRYATLFTYAPGSIPIGDFDSQQSYQLGLILAQIHQLGNQFSCDFLRPSLSLKYLLVDSFDAIAPFLHNRPRDYTYLKTTIEQITEQLYHFPQDFPFWTICWGDPHSGNVHFTNNNQVTLFDFDQCGYGYRIFDIAKFWQASIRTGMTRKTRDAFLQGYQSLTTLSELELNHLQSFIKMAHIWSWAIHVKTTEIYDYSRLNEYYFTQRLEKLKFLTSNDWQIF